MRIWIKNGRVIDPGRINGRKDLVISDGKIEAVLEPDTLKPFAEDYIVDAGDMVIVPGMIDVHVHLREPGHEHKETIETGLKAAAKGGFTAVCCMPNTVPVNDNATVTQFILNRARQVNLSRVYPVGAISIESKGKSLAGIADMKQAGIVAVTDDGLPVVSSLLMRRVLEYCKELDLPVLSHAEDPDLADGGAMNEGPAATLLGIKGIPNVSESIMVARDIALAGLTGSRLHICHVSCAESVETIRCAKKKGVRVTCETAPHYFTLTDESVQRDNTSFKMNPPLRSEKDRVAIIEGLKDGTIDIIATDHAPHSSHEKDLDFDRAAFGIIGLETALPLSLKLVQDSHLTLDSLISKLCINPAKLIGIDNHIEPGKIADITIIDPEAVYKINSDRFLSKSRNTPFDGMSVKGNAFLTMVKGNIIYSRESDPS